jgi:hypothetical protein
MPPSRTSSNLPFSNVRISSGCSNLHEFPSFHYKTEYPRRSTISGCAVAGPELCVGLSYGRNPVYARRAMATVRSRHSCRRYNRYQQCRRSLRSGAGPTRRTAARGRGRGSPYCWRRTARAGPPGQRGAVRLAVAVIGSSADPGAFPRQRNAPNCGAGPRTRMACAPGFGDPAGVDNG